MTGASQKAQPKTSLSHLASVWGLFILLVVLIVVFSLIEPASFPTYFNFRSIVNNKSVNALVALAVLLPMTANHFDLSVGFLLGISQVLVIGLQAQGLPWPEAAGVVLLLGAFVGIANGVLVTIVGIDSFIATLGTGTLLYGFNEWYTGGQQIVANLPASFVSISGAVFGAPLPAIYVLALSVVMWLVFEYMPVGRFLYVLGANPKAAELMGISARRYVTGAFLLSGVIAAFAGIVLQSQLQVGQSSVGQEYLLPGFTAALLGATSVHPGRVNVWGAILAVGVLAVTVAGLNQLGAPFFVEPIFNGATLIVAVGLAVTATKRRTRLTANLDATADKTKAAARTIRR